MRNLALILLPAVALPLVLAACNTTSSADCPEAGVTAFTGLGDLAAGTEGDPVVGVYDGKEIKLSELDAEARPFIIKAMMDIDQARQRTLEQMILEDILEQEATAAGMEQEAFLKAEMDKRVTEVTDEEAREFFEANPPRGGNADFETFKPRVVGHLERQKQQEAQVAFFDELKQKHGVDISLEPFRMDVSVDDDPSKGPEDAAVTIVEFADYQCGYCARARETTNQIIEAYPTQVRFVFRDYPIPKHPRAQKMSEAAGCANEQGKFWEYHDHLFDNMRANADSDLKKYAEELGLDTEAFNACYDEGRYTEEVQNDFEAGQQAGVSGTPAFFVNGRLVAGALPFDQFQKIIDEELERKGIEPPAAAETAEADAG